MALPKKFTNPWADSGGDITPDFTTAKRDVGFVGGDTPAIEDFNILYRENQLSINDIINEGPGSWYPDAADINKMICSGQWDESWGSTDDTLNIIAGGATKEYHDTCIHFDSYNNPYLLVLDNTNTTIEVYNARTKALVVTTNALSDDLDTSGTQDYECISMCTDGTNVFVTFTDVDAAPTEHWLQSWTIDLTAANWSVKTGWPATGTQLDGTGSGLRAKQRDMKVIIADDNNLAVVCTWVIIGASNHKAIQLFLIADGTNSGFGAGDCATGLTAQPLEAIASDGTNIFFATYVAGPTSYICSATIADLTAGSGGAGYPLTAASATCNDMCSCGVGGTIISTYDITGTTASDIIMQTHNATNASLLHILRGANAGGATANEYIIDEPRDLFFDGLNVWTLTMILSGSSGEDQLALVKTDLAKLPQVILTTPLYLSDYSSVFIINPTAESLSTGDAENMFLSATFDGRDIWVNVEPRSSETYSGDILRLPLALWRS